ncbi:tRNA (N6-isopentenyl adenosine(37)-C2)-methylthiotransferase MiaB [Candidatus Kuenenbacteria bacterium]|nr:tRNA (N6-isopentenyl adenosine(37)-C2)-methylthiotransferase MiaB [Candidatus Kuenenbacteria bacterium]
MYYKLITFGCQMNISDSERIASVLKKMKYQPTLDESKADLILINSCSVRQKAIDRIFGQEKKWQKLKKEKPSLIIALTGCITEKDKKKLKDKADLIFNIKELSELPKKIVNMQQYVETQQCLVSTDYFHIKPQYSNKTIAYVPIMTGCDNFCSYCVVPYTRGREIYRPIEKIICEIKNLVKRGYKEIILLGQNVNSYQLTINNQQSTIISFPQLLKMIAEIPGKFQITFLTSHPKDMSDELIDTMAKCEKIKKELHLPVQSGDDEILKKMNRNYIVDHYLKLVQKVREKIGKIFLSTDIIVGFPGETKKQFENTVKLCKKIKFNKAFISQYSPRPGTVSAKLKDNISKEEKKRRWEILNDLINS